MRDASEFIPKSFMWSSKLGRNYSYLTPEECRKYFDKFGLFIVYGFLRGSGDIIRKCIQEKKNYIYIDHPYFEDVRGWDQSATDQYWFRCTLNGMQHQGFEDRPSDRWTKYFNYPLKEWKEANSKILVIPPSDHTIHFEGVGDWLNNTIKELSEYKLIVRDRTSKIPLQEQFDQCFHLVTYHSLAAVKALQEGLTISVDNGSALYYASTQSMSQRNKFDRTVLFSHLSYCQFRIDEIKSGYAMETLLKGVN